MSLDVRYLTNGKKTCYVVKDCGVDNTVHISTYSTLEEVPKSIRHYAEHEQLKSIEPDLAAILGYLDIFFPGFPSCGHPDFAGERCIAESCKFAPDEDWNACPYFPGYSVEEEKK